MSASLLEIGLTRPLHIREERLSNREDACRLVYISDIHLRHGRRIASKNSALQFTALGQG
jgi:hypothetical protein